MGIREYSQSEELAARVLARLKVSFPSFARQFDGDDEMMDLAINEWAAHLVGMSEDEVKQGINAVRSGGYEFAPSASQFAKLCGGKKRPWHETWSGIVAKGQEIGLLESQFDSPQEFRAAVYRKAGIGNKLPSKPRFRMPSGESTNSMKAIGNYIPGGSSNG